MNIIDGKKVYGWCIGVIVAAVVLFLLELIGIKEMFLVVAYFGERIFSRHTAAKQEKKLEAIEKREYTVAPDRSVSRFVR